MNTITWKFCHTQQKRKPALVLQTIEETLKYLSNPLPKSDWDSWSVCSIPLMDFMDELEKTGYVYNARAIMEFSDRHGLGETKESANREGTELSRLVYNCQGYRRARKLEVEGWEPCTNELLAQALEKGQRLQVEGEGYFGTVQESFAVRIWKHDGQPNAFRPRKHRPMKVRGMPCRLVTA